MIRKERAARIAAQNQLAELQRQWQEERQNLLATFEQERHQAAEDRQAFLPALSELTSEIARLRQQRNGDGHNGR
jgi:hypothetical protein